MQVMVLDFDVHHGNGTQVKGGGSPVRAWAVHA